MAITLGPLKIDRAHNRAVVKGRVVPLRPLDLRVLMLLARRPDRAFSRDDIALKLWGPESTVDPRSVDACVSRLRRALNGAGGAIVTVRRVGYRFDPERIS